MNFSVQLLGYVPCLAADAAFVAALEAYATGIWLTLM